MGEEQRAPTPDELLRMQIEVQKAMRQGAWTRRSALIYPRPRYQTQEELIALGPPRRRSSAASTPPTSAARHDEVLDALDEAVEHRPPGWTAGRRSGTSRRPGRATGAGCRRSSSGSPPHVPRASTSRPTSIPTLAGANMLHADVPPTGHQSGGMQPMLGSAEGRRPAPAGHLRRRCAAGWRDARRPRAHRHHSAPCTSRPKKLRGEDAGGDRQGASGRSPQRGAARPGARRRRRYPGLAVHRQRARPADGAATALGLDRRRRRSRCARWPARSGGNPSPRLRLDGPAPRPLRPRGEALLPRGGGAEGHLVAGAKDGALRPGPAPPGDGWPTSSSSIRPRSPTSPPTSGRSGTRRASPPWW